MEKEEEKIEELNEDSLTSKDGEAEEKKVESEPLNETDNGTKEENNDAPVKQTRKEQIIEFLKFLAFSLSAGVIQLGSFELLYHVIKWDMWWPCYLISIVLSVIWNFTFNRKFTFKSASNVPIAMCFAFLFYCAFIPVSVFGGNALEAIGWHGTLVTVIMMVINFVTEFVWDKFVVFNDKLMNKIISKLHLNKKS